MVSQVGPVTVQDRLLDAAASIITEQGPTAATMSAIATRAGVSRMTAYRKYDDRHALLAALFNRELEGILAHETTVGTTYDQRIADLVVASVHALNQNPLMRAVLRHEPEQLTEWITGRLGRTQRRARDLLRAMLVDGQSQGQVRPGDPDQMALTLVLVAQTFVFAHDIGGSETELHHLVKGYLK
jgi:AcrR family transcriptional regulator